METTELDLDAIQARIDEGRGCPSRTASDLIAEVRKGREAADILGRALSGLNRALAEREEELERVAPVLEAWADAGPQPHAHRQAQRRLLRDWPTLANALTRAVPPIVGG